MKFFSTQHEFDYSWEEVSTNNWRKYCPWNDKADHVIAVDTLSRTLDNSTGIVSPSPPLFSTSCLAPHLPPIPAPHRTSNNLQTIRPAMALHLPRQHRHLPRLRNLLRQPALQNRHNVFPKPDLVGTHFRARNRLIQTVSPQPRQHDFRAKSKNNSPVWRLAEDKK